MQEDFLVDIPTQISIREPVFGLDFHPKRNLIAYSTAAGTIQMCVMSPSPVTRDKTENSLLFNLVPILANSINQMAQTHSK